MFEKIKAFDVLSENNYFLLADVFKRQIESEDYNRNSLYTIMISINDLCDTIRMVDIFFDKEDFIGRSVLAQQKEKGPERKSVSFKMTDKSPPPRQGYEIFVNGEDLAHNDVWPPGSDGLKHEQDEPIIGTVTSGTQSPSMGCGIGMALVHAKHAHPGKMIEIQIRSNLHQAVVCKKPLYKNK